MFALIPLSLTLISMYLWYKSARQGGKKTWVCIALACVGGAAFVFGSGCIANYLIPPSWYGAGPDWPIILGVMVVVFLAVAFIGCRFLKK